MQTEHNGNSGRIAIMNSRRLVTVLAACVLLGVQAAHSDTYNLLQPMPANLTYQWDDAIWQEGGAPGALDTAILDVESANRWWTVQTETNLGAGITVGTITLVDDNNTGSWLPVVEGYFPFGDGTGIISKIPEPASLITLALGMAAVLRRRRTRPVTG
jgi:hypothetical protein